MSTLAIEVHHHEGPRQLILLRSLSKSVFKDVGIQIPTCVVAVEEDGFGTEVANRIAARYEGKRGAKDLVAGPDTEQSQAKVDRGSSGATPGRPTRASNSCSNAVMFGPTVESQLDLKASRT